MAALFVHLNTGRAHYPVNQPITERRLDKAYTSERLKAMGTSNDIDRLRRGGPCSLVGLPPGDFPTPIFDVVLKRLTMRGSIVRTRKDLEETLQFAAEGKVKAVIETHPPDSISDVFRRLREGQINGRVVLDLLAR